MVGGTISVVSGGKFANGAKTFAFIRMLQEAPGFYKKHVRYDVDLGPGGAAVQKGVLSSPVEGANNIGIQGDPINDPCWACEGSGMSNMLNAIPGVNAVAGMHDYFQVSMGENITRDILNVPGMPVAAAITYGGAIGQALNNNPGIYVPINLGDSDERDSDYVSVSWGM